MTEQFPLTTGLLAIILACGVLALIIPRIERWLDKLLKWAYKGIRRE